MAPDAPAYVTIDFEKGWPAAVDGSEDEGQSTSSSRLNELGGANGIGLLDIVENRLVGMKDRRRVRDPRRHHPLPGPQGAGADHPGQGHQAHEAEAGGQTFADLVYNGKWFTPLREALTAFADGHSEVPSPATVKLKLYKGNLITASISSPCTLYSEDLVTFGESDYDQTDSQGFINLWGLPDKVQALREQGKL